MISQQYNQQFFHFTHLFQRNLGSYLKTLGFIFYQLQKFKNNFDLQQNSMFNQDILIIGAGPIGLIAAIKHAQVGYAVTVLEKRYTNDRRLYIHSAPPKKIIQQCLQKLKNKGIHRIRKVNSKNGENQNKNKDIFIDNFLQRISHDEQILIQIKQIQNILETYISQFLPLVKIIRGIAETKTVFTKQINKMTVTYKKQNQYYSLNFDRLLYAAGAGRLQCQYEAQFPQFINAATEKVKESLATDYQYKDNPFHAALVMEHLGDIQDLQTQNYDYDKQELKEELRKLGYEKIPSLRVIDNLGKKNDYFQQNPKDLVVVLRLPNKNKTIVVGPVPDTLVTIEEFQKWALLILKYKFPNKKFKHSGSNFVLDLQGEKKVQRLEKFINEAQNEQSKNYWIEKKDKLQNKLSQLSINQYERLQRKNKKDQRICVFKIRCKHLLKPVIDFPNGDFGIFIGDSLFSPEYPRGEGVPNGIKEIKIIMDQLSPVGTPLKKNTNYQIYRGLMEYIIEKLQERQTSLTQSSQNEFQKFKTQFKEAGISVQCEEI